MKGVRQRRSSGGGALRFWCGARRGVCDEDGAVVEVPAGFWNGGVSGSIIERRGVDQWYTRIDEDPGSGCEASSGSAPGLDARAKGRLGTQTF